VGGFCRTVNKREPNRITHLIIGENMKKIPKKFLFSKKGQSLIEVIVALGIVLMVMVSVASLILINIFAQRSSELRVVGSNLAREGIEVVRNLRDTARSLEQGFPSPSGHFFELHFDPTQETSMWTLASLSSGDIDAESVDVSLYDSGTYRVYTDTSGDYTGFRRLIIIDEICAVDTECTDGICANGEGSCTDTVGYRVTSEARWLEGEEEVYYEIVDYLYDWK